MNLPNRLTLLRIVLIPFLLIFLMWSELGIVESGPKFLGWVVFGRYMALFLFIIATVTDWLDGRIARSRGLITNFGRLMDPLADKLLIMAVYVAFVELRYFPAWVVVVILAREFTVTGLRQLAIEQGRVIQADWWGKNKTVAQMVTAYATFAALCMRDTMRYMGIWEEKTLGQHEMEWWMHGALKVLMALVIFFTLMSGGLYLYRNWDIVNPSVKPTNPNPA